MPLQRGAGAIGNHGRVVFAADGNDPLDLAGILHEGHRVGRRTWIPGLILAVLFAHGGGGRQAVAQDLAQLGVKLAKVEPRNQPIAQTLVVVRDPQQPVVARLKDLAAQYPGSEIKISACERAS